MRGAAVAVMLRVAAARRKVEKRMMIDMVINERFLVGGLNAGFLLERKVCIDNAMSWNWNELSLYLFLSPLPFLLLRNPGREKGCAFKLFFLHLQSCLQLL
jgi:hypothetical protein